MATSPAKENILKRIRQALRTPVPIPFVHNESGSVDLFHQPEGDTAIVFAEQFAKLQGKFAFCANEKELLIQLQQLLQTRSWTKVYCREAKFQQLLFEIGIAPFDELANCDVSITGCEYLIARTGTLVMSSAQQSGRTTSVYAPVHICIAYSHQLVSDINDALIGVKEKYKEQLPSLITFASGPSRTADIEKTLVTGVHGPKEVFCFLLEANR